MPYQTSQLDQQWLGTVVSIERAIGQEVRPVGTGFFVATQRDQVVLVTAKHVVRRADGTDVPDLVYRINQKSGASTVLADSDLVKSGNGPWFVSPTSDLAVRFMPRDSKSPHISIPLDLFLSEAEVQAGTPLAALGFPMGLRSVDHAMPVARRGMVGRSDNKLVLADLFVFPGNSGGPVLYVPPFRNGIALGPNAMAPSEMLVGMVSSFIPYSDIAISQQTQRARIVFEENSGLANLVPAWIVREFVASGDVDAFDRKRASAK